MENKPQTAERDTGRIVRILSKDIEGNMTVYAGLAKVKGISWSFANALCIALGLDKKKKIGALTDEEIKKISEFIRNPKLPTYILNRRIDRETGESLHLTG